jgi:hypothetical protein
MASDPLNRIYANEMQNHPYGYALYQPVFNNIIKPGAIGFFDRDGFWSPVSDLTDPDSLKVAGLKPPKHVLSPAPPQDQTWGPMTSRSVSGHNLDASAGTEYTSHPILLPPSHEPFRIHVHSQPNITS